MDGFVCITCGGLVKESVKDETRTNVSVKKRCSYCGGVLMTGWSERTVNMRQTGHTCRSTRHVQLFMSAAV